MTEFTITDARIAPWQKHIGYLADLYGLDPRAVAAVMLLESAGQNTATSSAGAIGLMQVMPRGSGKWFVDRPVERDLRDPVINVAYGCRILKSGVDYFHGDVLRGVLAYYMGAGGVDKRGVDCDDARTYRIAFELAWRRLWGDAHLPWERTEP